MGHPVTTYRGVNTENWATPRNVLAQFIGRRVAHSSGTTAKIRMRNTSEMAATERRTEVGQSPHSMLRRRRWTSPS